MEEHLDNPLSTDKLRSREAPRRGKRRQKEKVEEEKERGTVLAVEFISWLPEIRHKRHESGWLIWWITSFITDGQNKTTKHESLD